MQRRPGLVGAILVALLLRAFPASAGSTSCGGVISATVAGSGLACNCSLCTEALAGLCCHFSGIPATVLAFEEDDLWGPRLEEFNECTGAKVTLTYTPEGEDGMQAALEADVGVRYAAAGGATFSTEGAGIYDSYVVQAPWIPAIVDGLENLSPLIAQTPSLDWLDVNAMSRQIVSFNNTVRALPLDTDYIAFGYRADVFERWGKTPPETLEELVELSEFFNGKDHNNDSVPDWGFCLTPQPNYFYAFVAPVMQRARADCHGRLSGTGQPLCDGELTGQNPFFDVETFEPLLDNPGFRYAFDLHARFLRASNCQDQLFSQGKCDRKSAMQTGRCAGVISMPGTMTKLLLPWDQGGKYAPKPRYATDGVTIEWEVGSTSEGGYWGRRMRFPGSSKVYDAKDGALKECTPELCPKAVAHSARPGVLVNYAPFFSEGGEAYALRGKSAAAKKELMFRFFEWLASLPPSTVPLSGEYRRSQLTPEAQDEMVRNGMPEQVAADLMELLRFLFRDDETEGANNVQDLLILGFAEYMESFGDRVYSGLLLHPAIFNNSLSGPEYEECYASAIAMLIGDYEAINAGYGKVAQLQRWRTSLGLAQLSNGELCGRFAEASEGNAAAVRALGIACDALLSDTADVLRVVLLTLACLSGIFLTVAAVAWLVRTVCTNRRLRREAARLVDRQVEEACEKVSEIQAPFMVMKGSDVLALGHLVSHEEARGTGKLLCVDTMGEEMRDFLNDHYVVFFSHQWLGWEEPDPNNMQFAAMEVALNTISANTGLSMDELHVWCDWFSIPQKCRAFQKMAIASLPVFASMCHCFVALVPDSMHADTGDVTNQASFHRRAWCRAEVMSHWARRGTENMFYARGGGLVQMAPADPTDEFLEAIRVFHGDLTCCCRGHIGGVPCDKEFLMLPMLGLYQQIYASRTEERMRRIHDVIEPIISDVFPATFEYKSDTTGTVTKPLFGDLIQALRAKSSEDGAIRSCRQGLFGRRSAPHFRPGTTCSCATSAPRRDFSLALFEATFGSMRKTMSMVPWRSDFTGGTRRARSLPRSEPRSRGEQRSRSEQRSDSSQRSSPGPLHYLNLMTKMRSLRSSSTHSRCSNVSYGVASATSSSVGRMAGGSCNIEERSPMREQSPQSRETSTDSSSELEEV